MKVADLFARLSLRPDKRSFDSAEKAIGAVKSALIGLVSIRAVQWMGGLVKETVSVASAAVETAAKLGITAEAVQELGFAAGQSGSNQASLADGLGKMAKQADLARSGSKEAAAAFKLAGVDTKALANGSLKLDGALETIATKVASMPDGYAKSNLAMKLFGKSGRDLIPMLNAGGKGIAAMRKESRDLGGVIDNETAASLEDFGDQQDKVTFALGGIRNEVVRALLPSLQKMVAGFLKWVKANRQFLAVKLEKVMRGVVSAVLMAVKVFTLLYRIGETLAKHWQLAIVVLGSLKVAMLLMGAASMRAAIKSALAWAASLLPIIALGVAIAAVVLVVQDLWKGMNGGESVIMNLYKIAEEWIGNKLTKLLKRAREAVNEFLYGTTASKGGVNTPAATASGKRAQAAGFKRHQWGTQTTFDADWSAADQGKSYQERIAARRAMLAQVASFKNQRLPGVGTNLEQGRRAGMLHTQEGMLRDSISKMQFQRMVGNVTVGDINVTVPAGADGNMIGRLIREHISDEARKIANGG